MHLTDNTTASATAVVRDLTVHFYTSLSIMMVWMLLPSIAVSILCKVLLPPHFFGLSFLPGMLVGPIICERLAARRACSALRDLTRNNASHEDDLLTSCTTILSHYAPRAMCVSNGNRRRNVAGSFATVLNNHGHAGTAFRIAKDPVPQDDEFTTWPTPFEPIPLRDRDPALRAMRGEGVTLPGRIYEFLNNQREWHGKTRLGRALLYVFGVFITFSLLFTGYSTVQEMLAGQIPEIAIMLWPLLVFALVFQLWVLRRPREWYLVPGAVVIRTSSWNSSRWKLHLLPREDTVLVYWRDLRLLALADKTGHNYVRRATPREADTAIRAWLCPGPPLEVDQLSDLR